MSDLSRDDIAKEYQHFITVQNYASQEFIDGVKLVEIKNFVGEDGDFSEILRLNENGEAEHFPGFKVAQINRSTFLPHAVKAWHLHLKQDEVQTISPADRLFVGLWDVREDSPTKGQTMRITLGAGKAQLLYIPRGVAHGYANTTPKKTTIWYFVTEHFSLDDPDELRLPWDSLGPEFWTPVKE